MTELQNDPDGYNYLVTHFHFADVYQGVQNKLSNPQVVQDDVSTKDSISRDDIDTVEQPTFTVEGDKTVVIEGSRLTMESTGLAEGIFYYKVTATDASGSSMTRRVGVCVRK